MDGDTSHGTFSVDRKHLSPPLSDLWDAFNKTDLNQSPLGAGSPHSPLQRLGLYFPRPEIVPNVRAGTYRHSYSPDTKKVSVGGTGWKLPQDDYRAIIESQLLSLRLPSRGIVKPPDPNPNGLPAQPRGIYLVGGSSNPAIVGLFYATVSCSVTLFESQTMLPQQKIISMPSVSYTCRQSFCTC